MRGLFRAVLCCLAVLAQPALAQFPKPSCAEPPRYLPPGCGTPWTPTPIPTTQVCPDGSVIPLTQTCPVSSPSTKSSGGKALGRKK